MKQRMAKPIWQTIGLGIIAGMRTSSAPVIVNEIFSRHPPGRLADSPLKFIRSDYFGLLAKFMAAGELIVDKLPATPSRTKPVGLAARCLSGALAGACVFKASGNSGTQGALLGCLVAGVATFSSYALRKKMVSGTNINDPWIGAAEDALVAGTGLVLIKYS